MESRSLVISSNRIMFKTVFLSIARIRRMDETRPTEPFRSLGRGPFGKQDMAAPYKKITFPPGATIFQEGDEATFAYFIQKGRVAIVKTGNTIATVGDHMVFGEMALIDGAPRMASARALALTECSLVTAEQLLGKLSTIGPASVEAIEQMMAYIRATLPAKLRSADSLETPNEQRMRALIERPEQKATLKDADPFLRALYDILVGYVRVRLPEPRGDIKAR
jgi:CRP-like cAMP-binding protein